MQNGIKKRCLHLPGLYLRNFFKFMSRKEIDLPYHKIAIMGSSGDKAKWPWPFHILWKMFNLWLRYLSRIWFGAEKTVHLVVVVKGLNYQRRGCIFELCMVRDEKLLVRKTSSWKMTSVNLSIKETIDYLCLRLGLKRDFHLGTFFCYPTLWTTKIIVTQPI